MMVRFRGSKSRDVEFCVPQVELAATYDTAVNCGGDADTVQRRHHAENPVKDE